MRQYIGAVRAENNILSPLCLFVETMPIKKAGASGNGNRFFTQKLYIQIANKPDRHNAGLKFNYCLRFDPSHFSLPYTFNAGCMADVQYLPLLVSRDFFSLLLLVTIFTCTGVHSLLQPAACRVDIFNLSTFSLQGLLQSE